MRRTVLYREYREEIRSGDVLLWRPTTVFGRLISAASGSPWPHASMSAWLRQPSGRRRLYSLEVSRGPNVPVPLSVLVREHPGAVAHFRAPNVVRRNGWICHYHREAAVDYYFDHALGAPYGWRNALREALRHMALLRFFMLPNTDDSAVSGRPPFCSEAVAAAIQYGGGIDPVPGLAPESTWPCHLANSGFLEQRCGGLV